ncbi:hypothetical protein [Litoreibacter roseus]|uniref:Uncharacterized protein n=1 Tax=Litoreibacter roseus TaxID=2601869 RepID=A0A6N6JKH9_9RHOB|nr:hypothetical protein [Litoreibacter roseus]GFE65939.1 hypothetical protein KIN_30130 [Litoreibacter roseus]
MKVSYIALALLATPAAATDDLDLISPSEFEAFTSGSTLYFNRRGAPYGAEQYLGGRKVIWTFLDGTCQRGIWYAAQDEICFVYDGQAGAQCWYFFKTGDTKSARVVGDNPVNDLTVVGQDTQPLSCPGPGVGVSYTPAG